MSMNLFCDPHRPRRIQEEADACQDGIYREEAAPQKQPNFRRHAVERSLLQSLELEKPVSQG